MMVGIMMVQKSACVLKCERIQSTSANVRKAKVAILRGSTLPMFLPTMGENTSAIRPTGAMIMPACVAVYPMNCCSQRGNTTTLPKKRP